MVGLPELPKSNVSLSLWQALLVQPHHSNHWMKRFLARGFCYRGPWISIAFMCLFHFSAPAAASDDDFPMSSLVHHADYVFTIDYILLEMAVARQVFYGGGHSIAWALFDDCTWNVNQFFCVRLRHLPRTLCGKGSAGGRGRTPPSSFELVLSLSIFWSWSVEVSEGTFNLRCWATRRTSTQTSSMTTFAATRIWDDSIQWA